MRFQVPQFIETETKLIGPFTLMQFLWLAGGAVLLFLFNFILSGTYFILVAIPIVVIAVSFAYVKIEGMPLLSYIVSALSFSLSSKQYLFKKEENYEQYFDNTKNGQ